MKINDKTMSVYITHCRSTACECGMKPVLNFRKSLTTNGFRRGARPKSLTTNGL